MNTVTLDMKEAMARLPKIEDMRAAIQEGHAILIKERRQVDTRRLYPIHVHRAGGLYAINAATGDRFNDGDFWEWDGTKKNVAQLLMKYPECDEIIYDGGVNHRHRTDDDDYEFSDMNVLLYTRELGPKTVPALVTTEQEFF